MAKKDERRANGDGTVVKLPSGKYRLRMVVEIDGVKQRKSFTSTSPTACKNAYKKWMASDQKVAIESVKTVREWASHWLEVYKEPNVSWKVGKDYRMYVETHINETEIDGKKFGDLNLNDVRPAHVAKLYMYVKGKRGELSGSALNYIRISLNGIFNTAIDNNLCVKNPAHKVPLPDKPQADVKAFSKAQVTKITKYIDKHENGPYIALLLYTGLRIGEMLALMWSDIDAENRVIHVRRSITRSEDGEIVGETTKTKKERSVPYDEPLQKYFDKLPKYGLYVISRPDGSHHKHRSFDGIYYRFFNDLNDTIKKEAEKIPKMSPHTCRHTFATYLLRNDVDIRKVQVLMGHSTIKTTEIYTEVDVDDLKDNISKLKFG